MRASATDLRFRAGKLLAAAERGESIEITYRGRPCARLTDIRNSSRALKTNPAFGMWADRSDKDVAQVMERLRAPRNFS